VNTAVREWSSSRARSSNAVYLPRRSCRTRRAIGRTRAWKTGRATPTWVSSPAPEDDNAAASIRSRRRDAIEQRGRRIIYKVINLVKRKPHLTHAEFRDHFERSHAPMALHFCGHLFARYRRNYVDVVLGGGDPRVEGSGFGEMRWGWDLLSEWIAHDRRSFDEIHRIMAEPEIRRLFEEDEDRFIDRKAIVMMPCEVRDTGTVLDPRGTVFDTPDGRPRWD
jgi:hypothetical protein